MSTVDWSLAPKWASSHGIGGSHREPVWFNAEQYCYVGDDHTSNVWKFRDMHGAEIMAQPVNVTYRYIAPIAGAPQFAARPDVIGQIVNTVNGDAYDVTTHELRQGGHICVRAIDGQEWSYVGEEFVFRPNHIAAHEFLERGVKHMRDRAVQRDSDEGERSMTRAVAAFNAQEGTNLTEAQGWRFMIQLKYARAVNGVFVADDYEDMSAYAGLAGEAAQ